MWGTSQPFVSLHSPYKDYDWHLQGRVQGYPCGLRIVGGRNGWAKKLRGCRCSDQSWMCSFRSQTCCYRWEGMAKSQSQIYLTVKAGPRNLISELDRSLHCCWTDSSPEPSLWAKITENRQSCLQGYPWTVFMGCICFLSACLFVEKGFLYGALTDLELVLWEKLAWNSQRSSVSAFRVQRRKGCPTLLEYMFSFLRWVSLAPNWTQYRL